MTKQTCVQSGSCKCMGVYLAIALRSAAPYIEHLLHTKLETLFNSRDSSSLYRKWGTENHYAAACRGEAAIANDCTREGVRAQSTQRPGCPTSPDEVPVEPKRLRIDAGFAREGNMSYLATN
ncbi:hypothetical protein IG631_24240 [Alternaria alternata]|nr:hypothetical protein IG631_24240 [Alternaria alternata]